MVAHPENSDVLPVAIAEVINAETGYYWTRWGAARAKRYFDSLGLPVLLLVMEDQRP